LDRSSKVQSSLQSSHMEHKASEIKVCPHLQGNPIISEAPVQQITSAFRPAGAFLCWEEVSACQDFGHVATMLAPHSEQTSSKQAVVGVHTLANHRSPCGTINFQLGKDSLPSLRVPMNCCSQDCGLAGTALANTNMRNNAFMGPTAAAACRQQTLLPPELVPECGHLVSQLAEGPQLLLKVPAALRQNTFTAMDKFSGNRSFCITFGESSRRLGFGVRWRQGGEPTVGGVCPETGARQAGVTEGDVLVSCNDSPTLGRCRVDVLELLRVRPLKLELRRC